MATDEQPQWRALSDPADVAAAITSVFARRGTSKYDEIVSQNEHALQTGALAMADGADSATVAAAFLHDLGHLLLNERGETLKVLTEDRHHENVAARFLANWFPAEVCDPIRLHVSAKRYLCAVEPEYFDGLSDGSVRSLAVQGGPMSTAEIEAFESEAYYEAAVQLRRWDDLAKIKGVRTPGLDDFGELLVDVLNAA